MQENETQEAVSFTQLESEVWTLAISPDGERMVVWDDKGVSIVVTALHIASIEEDAHEQGQPA